MKEKRDNGEKAFRREIRGRRLRRRETMEGKRVERDGGVCLDKEGEFQEKKSWRKMMVRDREKEREREREKVLRRENTMRDSEEIVMEKGDRGGQEEKRQ